MIIDQLGRDSRDSDTCASEKKSRAIKKIDPSIVHHNELTVRLCCSTCRVQSQTGEPRRSLLRSACRTDSQNTITTLSGSAFEFLILSFQAGPTSSRRYSCLSIIDYYEPPGLLLERRDENRILLFHLRNGKLRRSGFYNFYKFCQIFNNVHARPWVIFNNLCDNLENFSSENSHSSLRGCYRSPLVLFAGTPF